MSENEKSVAEIKPDNVESLQGAEEVTKPITDAESIKIPIKFNKEIKELDITQAATLAQKGMKFDLISGDYERLRQMAQKNGSSVSDFITKLQKKETELRRKEILEECGGNEKIAERLMCAEENLQVTDGFEEVKLYFPHIKKLSDLPCEVVEKAALTGENLLNSLLRHNLETENMMRTQKNEERAAAQASVGSLKGSGNSVDAVNAEFLRGLWGR